MIRRLRAYLARRKRHRQIRQLEQCLRVLRPALAKPARSLHDVMERIQLVESVAKAEWCLSYLRERV